MSNFTPKVSVIIPVYNGANYLREAIDSALVQTYKNIEVIVINDGSTDNGATEAIAKSYGNKIRYIKKDNGGVATALNLGIEHMKGEYFSWLSHDDLYKPQKVEHQVAFLATLSNKDVVIYADYELINEKGKCYERRVQDHEMLLRVPIYSLLRGIVNGVTMLVPKKVFKTHGGFDVTLRCTQDYDMWLRIFNDYPFIHQQEILTQTRVHADQDTAANPAAVSEGNRLWVRMLKELPKKTMVDAEGSEFLFYLEMVKFIKYTPYDKAIEYCGKKLEDLAKSRSLNADSYSSAAEVGAIVSELTAENQQRAAAYFTANIVKQLCRKNKLSLAATVVKEQLVGDTEGVTYESITRQYLSRVTREHRRKRVMFCSGHWLTGGMERVLSTLFTELKDDYDLYLMTPFDNRLGLIELPDYVTHVKMSNMQFYDSFDRVGLTYALIFDVDVIVGFMNLFGKQLDLYQLCVDTGIKTVASSHEIYFYPYTDPYYYGLIEPRIDAFKQTDAALWLTNFSAAAYGLTANNSYLLPNPNAYDIQTNNTNRSEKIILSVGRFNDYIKRIDRILECFSLVSKQLPGAKLVLVGKCDRTIPFKPGDDTTVDDLIKKFRIDESRIEFVGEVSNVDEYYQRASVLLLTSNNEGFGMVINEAACFGVPTVCTRIPGLEDLVVDGMNGFMVDQDDIATMARKVQILLTDDHMRELMAAKAKKYVHRFSKEEVGLSWKYLIETLTAKDANSVKQSKLRNKLDYHIGDYEEYSRVLFSEMGKMVRANLDDMYARNSAFEHTQPKSIRRLIRLHRTIKTKGVRKTTQLIAKKVYGKLAR